MQAQQKNSSTKIQKEPKLMKRAFTTNWEIYRVCLPATCEQKVQIDNNEQPTTEESLQTNHSYEKLLLEAVDEELTSLGDPVKKAIYHYLKKTFQINRQDIPHKIDQFAQAIEEILGPGAKFLEIKIMKRLYQKVGHNVQYSSQRDDLLFAEYIEAAKL